MFDFCGTASQQPVGIVALLFSLAVETFILSLGGDYDIYWKHHRCLGKKPTIISRNNPARSLCEKGTADNFSTTPS